MRRNREMHGQQLVLRSIGEGRAESRVRWVENKDALTMAKWLENFGDRREFQKQRGNCLILPHIGVSVFLSAFGIEAICKRNGS